LEVFIKFKKGGPAGLRTAIELSFIPDSIVTVIEKRDALTRWAIIFN
jgi:hypothetical protein